MGRFLFTHFKCIFVTDEDVFFYPFYMNKDTVKTDEMAYFTSFAGSRKDEIDLAAMTDENQDGNDTSFGSDKDNEEEKEEEDDGSDP